MAIDDNKTPPTAMLFARHARLAGALSIALAAMGIAGVVTYLASVEDPTLLLTATGIGEIVLLLIVAAAGVQLARGQDWAQRFLLILWLAVLVGGVTVGCAMILWGTPEWWPTVVGLHLLLIPAALLEIAIVVLLVKAAAPGSRLRYGTNVALAAAAATALAIVVNLFSENDYLRADVESFRRFALSERTRKVLSAVDTPVTLTCVYTSTDEKDRTPQRRSRVMELLNEMNEQNRKYVRVADVTTDVDKAQLLYRLREQRQARAAEHVALLDAFAQAADRLAAQLDGQSQFWQQLSGKSYLDPWGIPADVLRLLNTERQAIRQTAEKVRSQRTGSGLPDYGALTDDVRATLEAAKGTLTEIVSQLAHVGRVPDAVRARKDEASKLAAASVAAAQAMAKAIGAAGDPPPADPAGALASLAKAADAASGQVGQAAKAMEDIAGKDLSDLVQASQVWQVGQASGLHMITADGRLVPVGRASVTDLFVDAARVIGELKGYADTYRQAATAEFQQKMIVQLRTAVAELVKSLQAARQAAEKGTAALTSVDEPTAAILKQAADGDAFKDSLPPMTDLLEKIAKLPKLESDTLATSITGRNIVLVEAGGKVDVVDFESVWPLKVQPVGPQAESSQERLFDGDSAVSSKLLSMTHEKFATVLITYYRPQVPPEMARMVPEGDIRPADLSSLRRRLEDANFEVAEWNLVEDKPAAAEGRGQVLLILPPPAIPPMPFDQNAPIEPFGPQHLDKIRQAINEGAPAIFLAMWMPPRQYSMFTPAVSPPYLPGEYLKEDWGIEVLTDYLVFPAAPDTTQPGMFRVDPLRLTYLRLNTFADHPIGQNLQGQRTMWRFLCPIRVDALPEGVTVEPVLTVPAEWTDTWATNRLEELFAQFLETQSTVAPDYAAGDLKPPLNVAVAASRAEGEEAKPARVVVLAMGGSLMDGYLDGRVQVLDSEGSISVTDPPRADADVVVNSAYWLIGRQWFIAPGPSMVQPIAMVPEATRKLLWGLTVIGLPAAVLLVGGIVLAIRRAS